MNGGTGTCENGTKYCIRRSSLPVGTSERWRMSCATPTTSRQGTAAEGVGGPVAVSGSKSGSNPMRMHLPIALSPGQTDRAMVSFTTTTGAPCSSAAVSFRPSRILMPRMSKNSGVAACRNGSCPPAPGGSARPGHGNRRHVEARERDRGNRRGGAHARHARARARAPRRTGRREWRRRAPARRPRRRRPPCSCRSPARAGCRGFGRTCRRRRAAAPTAPSAGRAGRSVRRRVPAVALARSPSRLPAASRRGGSRRSRSPRRWRRGRPHSAAASSIVRPAPSPAATSGRSTCLTAPSNHDASSSDTPVAATDDDGRFDARLQQQAPARGPQRRANGELPPPPRRAHEQQRGGVREPDDEHERRHARQPPGHAPIGARHLRSAEGRQHDAASSSRRSPAPPPRPPSRRRRACATIEPTRR